MGSGMRAGRVVIIALVIAMIVTAAVYAAQQPSAAPKPPKLATPPGAGAQGMMPHPMGMSYGMMHGMMMARVTLNVTPDSVYLFVGHLLQRYDRDLNLVKETYVPVDAAAMGKTMQECMENCPMRPGMRGGRMMPGGGMQGGGMQSGTQPGAGGMAAPRAGAGMRPGGGRRQMGMMGAMGMCPMCAAVSSVMMQTAIAVADDSTYVFAGGKVMKYDGDLNLVKEAEVKVDFAKMRAKMQEMMENFPMMGQGMQPPGGGMAGPGMMAPPPAEGGEQP